MSRDKAILADALAGGLKAGTDAYTGFEAQKLQWMWGDLQAQELRNANLKLAEVQHGYRMDEQGARIDAQKEAATAADTAATTRPVRQKEEQAKALATSQVNKLGIEDPAKREALTVSTTAFYTDKLLKGEKLTSGIKAEDMLKARKAAYDMRWPNGSFDIEAEKKRYEALAPTKGYTSFADYLNDQMKEFMPQFPKGESSPAELFGENEENNAKIAKIASDSMDYFIGADDLDKAYEANKPKSVEGLQAYDAAYEAVRQVKLQGGAFGEGGSQPQSDSKPTTTDTSSGILSGGGGKEAPMDANRRRVAALKGTVAKTPGVLKEAVNIPKGVKQLYEGVFGPWARIPKILKDKIWALHNAGVSGPELFGKKRNKKKPLAVKDKGVLNEREFRHDPRALAELDNY